MIVVEPRVGPPFLTPHWIGEWTVPIAYEPGVGSPFLTPGPRGRSKPGSASIGLDPGLDFYSQPQIHEADPTRIRVHRVGPRVGQMFATPDPRCQWTIHMSYEPFKTPGTRQILTVTEPSLHSKWSCPIRPGFRLTLIPRFLTLSHHNWTLL